VLQCVAVCCSVLYCVAVCGSMLQCVVLCCSVWQYVAVIMLFIGNKQVEDQFDLHRMYSSKEPFGFSIHGVRGLCLHLRVVCGSLCVCVQAMGFFVLEGSVCRCGMYVAVCCIVLQCVAMVCKFVCFSVMSHVSALQCVAVCCSELRYVAVCCSVLQWLAGSFRFLLRVIWYYVFTYIYSYLFIFIFIYLYIYIYIYNIYICIYVCRNIYTYISICVHERSRTNGLWYSSTQTLQHTATHCNSLQHTTTHCNISEPSD